MTVYTETLVIALLAVGAVVPTKASTADFSAVGWAGTGCPVGTGSVTGVTQQI